MGLLGKVESFGKAVWDAGKEAVDIVGDVAAVVDGAGAVGGFIERVGKFANLDDVIEVGGRLAEWAKRAGLNKFLRAADSPILDGGQLVIAGMKLTTGLGEPEDGELFGKAGARFHDAASTLRSARPTESWSGAGALSYAGQNVSQTARTKTMAAADHEVHGVLATEAFQVEFHRDRLDDWYNWLADVGLVTFALGLIPGVGQGLKSAADAHAVLAAVGSSSMELYQLSSEVEANAAALHQLVGRYEDVAQTANLSPTGLDPRPPQPPPPPQSAPEQPPSGGPGDQQPDSGPATRPEQTLGTPDYFVPHVQTPGPSGSGAGPPARGAPPTTDLPETPPPAEAETPGGGGAPAALGAQPGVAGGALPAMMSAGAAPMAASPGIPIALIKEAVQAAVQREAEKLAAEKDGEEDKREEDKDGDGKPDEDAERAEDTDEPAAVAGGIDAGRPPVHIEMDVDVERLNTPITVRVDRESPIGSPPAPTP